MTRRDYVLCVLSGLLAAAAFPPLGAYPLAWIAWVPLLLVVRGRSPRAAFRPGFVAGLVAMLGTFHWIVVVVHTYGHSPLSFAIFALVLLAAYLALYPAAWAVGVARAARLGEGTAVLAGAGLWVALEFVRMYLISGFPWALLGNSQALFLPLIQISEWTGAYGVSFLVILSNLALAALLGALIEGKPANRAAMRVGIVALIVAIVVGYGVGRRQAIETLGKGRHALTVSLVQANIPQDVKWDPANVNATLQRYLSLTAEASKKKPDLIVWPEAAATFYFQDDQPLTERVLEASRKAKAPIFLGSTAYDVDASGEARNMSFYNSAFLVTPAGRADVRYDKMHLVPFGEYVPYRRFLPFLSRVATGIASGDFVPGKKDVIFRVNGHRFGALICYEGIFPELSRRLVRHGADILVNITNDAWFGRSGAPGQHLEMTVFRAVENRTGIARAANTGYSALIEPTGEMTVRTKLFEMAQVTGKVTPRLLDTFYARHGDVFACLCVALAALGLVGRSSS